MLTVVVSFCNPFTSISPESIREFISWPQAPPCIAPPQCRQRWRGLFGTVIPLSSNNGTSMVGIQQSRFAAQLNFMVQ